MPTHVFTLLRAEIKAVLEVALADVDWRDDYWARGAAAGDLPRGWVRIPGAQVAYFDREEVVRTPRIQVLIQREGGDDLQDVQEADSAAIEAAVLPVLEARSHDTELTRVDFAASGDASSPVGEVLMEFTAALVTPPGDPTE